MFKATSLTYIYVPPKRIGAYPALMNTVAGGKMTPNSHSKPFVALDGQRYANIAAFAFTVPHLLPQTRRTMQNPWIEMLPITDGILWDDPNGDTDD
jgi:hypothetical protein